MYEITWHEIKIGDRLRILMDPQAQPEGYIEGVVVEPDAGDSWCKYAEIDVDHYDYYGSSNTILGRLHFSRVRPWRYFRLKEAGDENEFS